MWVRFHDVSQTISRFSTGSSPKLVQKPYILLEGSNQDKESRPSHVRSRLTILSHAFGPVLDTWEPYGNLLSEQQRQNFRGRHGPADGETLWQPKPRHALASDPPHDRGPHLTSLRGAPKQLRLVVNDEPFMRSWLEGLPTLPASHAPGSPQWSNSIALCAVMKDEAVEDVVEWLQYYRWLGLDHVFLTDNSSEKQAAFFRRLSDRFPASFLSLRTDDRAPVQMRAYAWCAETQRASFNWLAFFDLDEFLVLRQDARREGAGLPDLKGWLDGYRDEAGVAVHWTVAGPSGHDTRPRNGGALRHYALCDPSPDGHVKTVVNTYFLEALAIHPHNFIYRDGRRTVLQDGRTLLDRWHVQPRCKAHSSSAAASVRDCMRWASLPSEAQDARFAACCLLSPAAVDTSVPANATAFTAGLWHFATKSKADFALKVARGSGMGRYARKSWDYFYDIQRRQRNDSICQLPSKLWQLCCQAEAALGSRL